MTTINNVDQCKVGKQKIHKKDNSQDFTSEVNPELGRVCWGRLKQCPSRFCDLVSARWIKGRKEEFPLD